MAAAMKKILFLGFILAATAAISQQDAKQDKQASTSPAGAESKSSNSPNQKPGTFYDQELNLHFKYPEEMRVLDGNAEMESGHQNVYGTSGNSDPEHLEAKRCTRFLLDTELPQDKAPQRPASLNGMWTDEPNKSNESKKPTPMVARILVVEIARDCLPKNVQQNDDDASAGIAKSFVSIPGIKLMPKPLWYEVGKQKIHMNSGVGRPVINGQPAAEPIIVMSMSTQWNGHLLAWVFTSNDAEIFNEITKSLVQFGNGPWGPMFAGNIGPEGSGVPMTILPR
jgi:hypothetical protein